MARSSTTFKKGQVANPTGRSSKDIAAAKLLKQAILEHKDFKLLVPRLYKMAINQYDDYLALKAIQELFDRGIGKPTQAVELSGKEDAPPIPLSFIDAPPQETYEQWIKRHTKEA